MVRLLRITFRGLLWLSLLLFVFFGILWALSYRAGFHFTYETANARYALRSASGNLIISGPPIDGPDDETARQIAGRMNNDDFIWQPPIERRDGWWIEGDARPGSATWEMFQRFRDRPRELEGMAPAERVWIKALDDPQKFLPAHTMLLLFTQRWREATVWDNVPEIFLPATPETTKPDLPHWMEVRKQWHNRLDVQIHSLPYAFLAAVSLIVPFIWLTQPRRREWSVQRWMFNTVAASSLLLCIASIDLWSRSNSGEYWRFADRPAEPFPFDTYMVSTFHQRWIGSARGRLIFSRGTSVAWHWHPHTTEPSGYHKDYPPIPIIRARDERHWTFPGLEFYSMPFNAVHHFPKYADKLAYVNGFHPVASGDVQYSNVLNMWGGYRKLFVSWWLIVLFSAILPALWGGNWARYYLRQRATARRQRRNLCASCGYDLRATPDRCPECGAIKAAA
jgi:hypothetical protein